MSYYVNRTPDGRMYGPCMCGATDCPSCGPAQGYRLGEEDDEEYTEEMAMDEAEDECRRSPYAISWWIAKMADNDPAAQYKPLVRGRDTDTADAASFDRLLVTLLSVNYDDVLLAALRELRARFVKAHAPEIAERAADLMKENTP